MTTPKKSQAEIDKEAAAASEAAKALAAKNAAKAAEKEKLPEGAGVPTKTPEQLAADKEAEELAAAEATPPETFPDDLVDQLDAATGQTTAADEPEGANFDDSEGAHDYRGAAVRVKKLTDLLEAKKDEFIIYGYGGAEIRLGDLRGLLHFYQ